MKEAPQLPTKHDDPWELLLVAFVFILVGANMLFTKHSEMLVSQPTRFFTGVVVRASADELHVFGGVFVTLGAPLITFYFKLRRDGNRK